MDEFVAKEEKFTNKIPLINKMYLVLPIPFTIIGFVVTLISDGFESDSDMAIFVVIMLGIEYLIMIAFYKMESKIYVMRKNGRIVITKQIIM